MIYRPETERLSHYFQARLPDQFDGILHFDHSRAVEPLERSTEWEAGRSGRNISFGNLSRGANEPWPGRLTIRKVCY